MHTSSTLIVTAATQRTGTQLTQLWYLRGSTFMSLPGPHSGHRIWMDVRSVGHHLMPGSANGICQLRFLDIK